jgi:hypothetical protein
MNWAAVDRDQWLDLAVATFAVFGFVIPPLGRDLRRVRVFLVLGVLCGGHLAFCLHFLERGIHVRPLLYAPVAVAEVFVVTVALVRFGGARLDDFRESLLRRHRK